MALAIIERGIFEQIAKQLAYYATVNDIAAHITQDLDTSEIGLMWLINNLQTLNIRSCKVKNYPCETMENIALLPTQSRTPISEIGFLKHLTFIEGFIDPKEIEKSECLTNDEYNAFDTLILLIRRTMEAIIVRLPEYKDTPWPDEMQGILRSLT